MRTKKSKKISLLQCYNIHCEIEIVDENISITVHDNIDCVIEIVDENHAKLSYNTRCVIEIVDENLSKQCITILTV